MERTAPPKKLSDVREIYGLNEVPMLLWLRLEHGNNSC